MKYGELYVENEQKYESMEDQNTDKDVGGYNRVVQCECMQTTQTQGEQEGDQD